MLNKTPVGTFALKSIFKVNPMFWTFGVSKMLDPTFWTLKVSKILD